MSRRCCQAGGHQSLSQDNGAGEEQAERWASLNSIWGPLGLRCMWKCSRGQRKWTSENLWSQVPHCEAVPSLLETRGVESLIGHSSFLPCPLLHHPTPPNAFTFSQLLSASEFCCHERLFPDDAWPPPFLFSNIESNLWCPFSLIRLLSDSELGEFDLKQIVAPASDCSWP